MESTEKELAIFHALLDASVDAVIVSDSEGVIVRTNPAAARLFGYDTEDMLARRVEMLMPVDMADRHPNFITHHLETGEARIIGIGREVEGRRKDGSVFPLHISIGHAEVEGETYFVGILHDLSRSKATQRALERSQRLDAIGQMTGGIAHDFNNLLTVIIGNLELLELRAEDPKTQSLVRNALASAELGAGLIRQLMVFARQGRLRPVEADLGELCSQTFSMLERTLGEEYDVVTDIAPDLHPALIDPVQLQTALTNLALNARDAMPRGGELLITLENITINDRYMAQEASVDMGEYVRLSVSDNGQGMSPEAQQRAFEPFYTTKADQGGTGLGLAMVYGFVRQSGGYITFYSEAGHGTTFSLYFPALTSSGDAVPVEAAAEVADLQRGQGETILVVEDNPLVRGFAVERLHDLGYRIREAESGDDAHALLKSGFRPDLVFTDLVMPGDLNGYDLKDRIASDFPDIKVLVTSGYASDVVTHTNPHEQDHDILHKPYHHAELARRIRALLAPD